MGRAPELVFPDQQTFASVLTYRAYLARVFCRSVASRGKAGELRVKTVVLVCRSWRRHGANTGKVEGAAAAKRMDLAKESQLRAVRSNRGRASIKGGTQDDVHLAGR